MFQNYTPEGDQMNVLYADDDVRNHKLVLENLNGARIEEDTINLVTEQSFENALSELKMKDYDLIILDVFRGKISDENQDRPGLEILDTIRNTRFIPVIFFTGLVKYVETLESEVVKIVNKNDGIGKLEEKITELKKSGLIDVRRSLIDYVEGTIKHFFWDFVDSKWEEIQSYVDSETLRLLLVRRLSLSLAKENLPNLIGESNGFAKPIEAYVYPPLVKDRLESGDILLFEERIYVVLTPTCDLFPRKGGKIKAENVLLALASPLEERKEYIEYMKSEKSDKKYPALRDLVSSRKGTLFFLPGVFFLRNYVLDFEKTVSVNISELKKFEKIAKLDSPFAESMLSNFVRQYNRIGFPDLDPDEIIKKL